MIEEWRIAAGTDGRYEVSDLGRVRRSDGLVIKASIPRHRREYPAVMLRHSGKRKRVAVHRLVALNFLGLPPCAGAEVRHLDGDHCNPKASNLAWGTRKQNAADREKHGRTARGKTHGFAGEKHLPGESNPASKLNEAAVREIRKLQGSFTQRALAKRYGVTQGVIWRIINNKAWTHIDDELRAQEAHNG